MNIGNKEIPLEYDGRKTFIGIRRPTEDELHDLESYELTSPHKFVPDDETITSRRNTTRKEYKKYPGGLTLLEWRQRLAMAPKDVVRKHSKLPPN